MADQSWYVVRPAIERFFKKKHQDDLLLLYFSGHGRKESGELYLIMPNTEHDALDSTAVAATFIRKHIDNSFSNRKVIILDCCHSGAFIAGEKGAGVNSRAVQEAFEGSGYGRIILTAASAAQTAHEQAAVLEHPEILDEIHHSLFTHFLIEGLQTGEADQDNDGKISADELFEYASARLREITTQQTPELFVARKHGEIFIARNPNWQEPHESLPEWITNLLASRDPDARLAGVKQLRSLSLAGEHKMVAVIRNELRRVSQEDRDYIVRGAARGVLEELEQQRGAVLEEQLDATSQVKPHEEQLDVTSQVEPNEERQPEEEEKERKGEKFQFETVTVDANGKITKRTRQEAYQQVEDLGNGVRLEMVYVLGGTFLMGQTEAETQQLIKEFGEEKYKEYYSRELPQHEVHVKEFWMGKYPVTQAQWETLMGSNPSSFKGGNRPVESVLWDDVQKFLKKLNVQRERNRGNPPLPLPGGETPPRAPSRGEFRWSPSRGKFRLPSEAEWEYACRTGTTTPFYFGETITTDLANYDGNYTYASGPKGEYCQQTTAVGSFPPNAFGLYDMHGNVWEWCADPWHDNYEGAPTDGSLWEEGGDTNLHLLRGGSWADIPNYLRCANRHWLGHLYWNLIRGFRLVCGGVGQ